MKVESKQTTGSLGIEETMLSRETEATSRCKAEYPKRGNYIGKELQKSAKVASGVFDRMSTSASVW